MCNQTILGRKESMSEAENKVPGTPAYAAPQPIEQPAPEEPARLGPLGRLTGTLMSPGETFADVNRKPTWIAPMIIAIVTVLASTLFFQWRVKPDWDQIMRNQIRKRMERSNQSLTEEQMQQQVNIAKTIAKFSPIIGAVFTPIIYVIVAGIFALGLMFIQAKTTFKKILSVVAWSYAVIGILATIVTIASLMVRDEESLRNIDPTQSAGIVPTNLAAFLPAETSAVIKSLAGSLDIFTIWILILLSIGFAAIAGSRKISTGKTARLVFGFWAVFVLIKAGWAAIFG
jgi:Yip1 domain